MITGSHEIKSNKKETPSVIEEQDGFIGENKEIRVEIENKTGKSSSIKKFAQTNNLNNLILSCVRNDEYCYSILDYLKKIFHFSQIDYYSAYTQILFCFKPKEINEMAKIRKHLKNQWARDDPGFLIILVGNLFVSSLVFCLTFGKFNIYLILQMFLFQAFFCLITFGLFVGFALKILVEKYLKNEDLGFNRMQSIEFLYAFDIHCNGFVPLYFFSCVFQYFLLPVVLAPNMICTFISNGLVLLGILYYFYVTLLCYYSLPFIKKNKFLTLGTWPLVFIFIMISFLNVNILQTSLDLFINK